MFRKLMFACILLIGITAGAQEGLTHTDVRGFGIIFTKGGLRRPCLLKAVEILNKELVKLGHPCIEINQEFLTVPAKGFTSCSAVLPYYQESDVMNRLRPGTYGLKLSTFGPFQNDALFGIGLALFTDDARDVYGLQFAGFEENADNLYGIQAAPYIVFSTKKAYGIQLSALIVGAAEQWGIQCAPFASFALSSHGFQISGLCNIAVDKIHGIQAGLLNYASDGTGIQIGLLNYMEGAFFPVFPLINFKF